MVKVSVIIPSYNAEKFIREAIDSVLNQTYKDYEIIIIDDGSTDSTKEVVALYGQRARYVYQMNRGVSAARNRGILCANGEYVAFLDSDDMWLPNKLALQVAVLDNDSEIGLVFCDAKFTTDEKSLSATKFKLGKKPHSGTAFRELLKRNFIGTSTVIVRKKCFDAVGLFDEALALSEDHDMWIRIARDFKVDYIDKPLTVAKIIEKSLSKNEIRLQEANLVVLKKTFKENPSLLMDRNLLDEVYCPLIKRLGFLYLREGNNQKAKRFLEKYIALKRRTLTTYILALVSYFPPAGVLSLWAAFKALLKNRFFSPIRYRMYSSFSEYDYNWIAFSDKMQAKRNTKPK